MIRKSVLWVGFILLMASVGCAKEAKNKAVLVEIGDTKITVADFEERISNLPQRYQNIINKQKNEYLNELINDTLLYQEAIDLGLQKDKDVQKVMEEARKKILIAKLLKDKVDDAIVITDEEVKEYYEKNQAEYMTPEIMRVSHILVFSRDAAEKILQELRSGRDFEEVARARSLDPTAQRGGDIGYFPKGQLMPEFEAACSALEIGQMSGAVKTKLGYHIIKLTDRKAPQPRSLEQVEKYIKAKLRTLKRQVIFNELLTKLHKETRIKINEKNLKGEENSKNVPEK
ncbi:MAG: peptidyl-prolyl cis-trans isomerase [Candidatus Omnitrophica bacterium]|nr:peptidyl-prolyl cis-trans isomerase [Candidatus Omnitrophota bacterium]